MTSAQPGMVGEPDSSGLNHVINEISAKKPSDHANRRQAAIANAAKLIFLLQNSSRNRGSSLRHQYLSHADLTGFRYESAIHSLAQFLPAAAFRLIAALRKVSFPIPWIERLLLPRPDIRT